MIADAAALDGLFLCVRGSVQRRALRPPAPFIRGPFVAPAPRSLPPLLTRSAHPNATDEPLMCRWSTSFSPIKLQRFFILLNWLVYFLFFPTCIKSEVYNDMMIEYVVIFKIHCLCLKKKSMIIVIYHSSGKTLISIHGKPFLHTLTPMNTLWCINNALTNCDSEKVLQFRDSTFLMVMVTMSWCVCSHVCAQTHKLILGMFLF